MTDAHLRSDFINTDSSFERKLQSTATQNAKAKHQYSSALFWILPPTRNVFLAHAELSFISKCD